MSTDTKVREESYRSQARNRAKATLATDLLPVRGEGDPMIRLGEAAVRAGAESLLYLFLNFIPWCKSSGFCVSN